MWSRDNENSKLISRLNELGDEGWELVSIIASQTKHKPPAEYSLGYIDVDVIVEKYILKRAKS